jgi:uncharacterized protein (TIGR02453 family)
MNIEKSTFQFLKDLKKNNNRDWFNENKPVFKAHEASTKSFFKSVQDGLNLTDKIESHKVWRIYRDVRFSKDKTPYKSRFAGSFARLGADRRGGYYLNIEPGNAIVGGGFYGPNKEDLLRIRKEFEQSDKAIRKILDNADFKTYFPNGLEGEELKSAPRGFDKEHKSIDLIRKKQFIVLRRFSDSDVIQPGFEDEVLKTYKVIRTYFDFMSDVLTTDLNGESIL